MSKRNDHDTKESIFYIIKIYAEKINRDDNTALLESNDEYMSKKNRPTVFFSTKYSYDISESFRIYLGKSSIITDIWKKYRQVKALEKNRHLQ